MLETLGTEEYHVIHVVGLIKLLGTISIVTGFASVLYIRHLARKHGQWNQFMYSFSFQFYRDHWDEVKLPLSIWSLSIAVGISSLVLLEHVH
jgi:hypothetical protein